MSRKKTQGNRFEFRTRTGEFPGWGGMLTEGTPSSNPANRPRMLVNARIEGGDIVERDGLTAFNSSAFHASDACVRHIDDFPFGAPVKLWMVHDGCPGISSSVGFGVSNIDHEQSPEYQRGPYYNTSTTSVVMATFDGGIYIGVDASLRRINLVRQRPGEEMLAIGGSSQDTPLVTFTGFVIRCMKEFDGKLFIGLDNGTGASKIVTWDGVSVRDDVTTIDAPTCFALWHVPSGGDALYVGFGANSSTLRYRPTGDSPGTWTTVTPGAGTVQAMEMISYKDNLYIASFNGAVWKYDGSTLASINAPASATAMYTVTVFAGFLFYGYQTATAAFVGRFDGSTWLDTHKNLTTQFTLTSSVRNLKPYRNSLYAAGIRDGAGRVFFSPETSTSGSWTQIIPNASNVGDFDQLLVA